MCPRSRDATSFQVDMNRMDRKRTLVSEIGEALGFAARSRWWWLVIMFTLLLPILLVLVFMNEVPLVAPFVYTLF